MSIPIGYGIMAPTGDVDFYPNGGEDQPGCGEDLISGLIQNGDIACNHGRAHWYFIESINSTRSCRVSVLDKMILE